MELTIQELLQSIPDLEIREEEALCEYTGFRTGGKATVLFPLSLEALKTVLSLLKENKAPYFILGNGSNVLALDEGYSGFIVSLKKCCNDLAVEGDRIRCGAGVALNVLCRTALDHSLTGLEFAYGIPGTVGGAVYMNAGAYGGEIKDVLQEVCYLDEEFVFHEAPVLEACLEYRNSIFQRKDWVILSGTFKLTHGDEPSIKQRMDELIQKRKEKQPLEYPSCGSTFKRPVGGYAAELIERAGLKGKQIGGAQVSEKHAGFIINKEHASSQDILDLMEYVSDEVFHQFGVRLEREVEVLS